MTNSNSPSQSDLIKDTLFALTELSASARAERLQALQKSDPELAAAVLALLPGALLTDPGLDVPRDWMQSVMNTSLPERLGPWRVLREVGRGGMGIVMLGERADAAFEMQVAIKVLPPILLGSDGAERLTAEARVLSRLTHPNIARLLDAGFEQGCAYLVMEYIDGVPLTQYADKAQLSIEDRVKLVLDLCSAVRFAHTQLLVHRDIKPANVLVDKNGRVRLLDFGIAKVLQNEELTQTLHQACTPAYASPEQLLGQNVSVATDVFSLGVILYELLAGQRPFGAESKASGSTTKLSDSDYSTTLATMHAVLETEPSVTPLAAAQIPTDLRAIVLKALEKPLTRRYATAEALALDLQSFLEGRPVNARTPSARYQFQKFVARHRWAVSGGAIASCAVVGFAVWAMVNAQQANLQRTIAQKRLDAVRSIANKVVFDYNAALRPLAGALAVRKTLVSDALGYLDALSQDAQGDRQLEADIAAGLEAIGDVQGRGATEGNLGDLPGAKSSYEKAITLRRQHCDNATPGQAMRDCAAYARVLVRLGDNVFTSAQTPEAIAYFETALQVTEKALALPGKDQNLKASLLDARFDAAQRLAGLSGRQTGPAYARGLDLARAQLQAAQDLAKIRPSGTMDESLRIANDLLAVRLLNNGQADLALNYMESSISLARKIRQERPGRDADVSLAVSLTRLAEIQAHRLQASEARLALTEGLTLARSFHESDPQDMHLRARYANVARRWAQVHNQIGDAQALKDNRQILPSILLVSGIFKPEDGVFYLQHQQLKIELAQTLLLTGDARGALQMLASFPDAMPTHPRAAADLAPVFVLRAQALMTIGKSVEASTYFGQAHKVLQQAVEATPADVQQAANLLYAEVWALKHPAIATQYSLLKEQFNEKRAALEAAGQLSAWWKRALS
ncbi:protein kinase domain-containing protein [Undibacterium sp. Ji22W]|uniref:serine/threonine protein kinase n=1 Tax=Undibacterium sp. Ji22W TaxID=3413038 RepID=UPI003BF00974